MSTLFYSRKCPHLSMTTRRMSTAGKGLIVGRKGVGMAIGRVEPKLHATLAEAEQRSIGQISSRSASASSTGASARSTGPPWSECRPWSGCSSTDDVSVWLEPIGPGRWVTSGQTSGMGSCLERRIAPPVSFACRGGSESAWGGGYTSSTTSLRPSATAARWRVSS